MISQDQICSTESAEEELLIADRRPDAPPPSSVPQGVGLLGQMRHEHGKGTVPLHIAQGNPRAVQIDLVGEGALPIQDVGEENPSSIAVHQRKPGFTAPRHGECRRAISVAGYPIQARRPTDGQPEAGQNAPDNNSGNGHAVF